MNCLQGEYSCEEVFLDYLKPRTDDEFLMLVEFLYNSLLSRKALGALIF